MIWKTELEFDVNNDKRTDFLTRQVLTEASTGEIKSLLNRITFYLEHFTIINKKRESDILKNKIYLLNKLNKILNNEITNRNKATAQLPVV